MGPIHYEKFEELLDGIRNMIKKYPYIIFRYEKTFIPYINNDLRVIFHFGYIYNNNPNVTLGIIIDESTTTNDINKFVFRCEEMINVKFVLEKRPMDISLYPSFVHMNKQNNAIPGIKKVIFNKPATIVFWTDGTKTVVKAQGKERYDEEKGLAIAIAKKALGNEGNYYDTFKEFLD